jgi:hypothetical protein
MTVSCTAIPAGAEIVGGDSAPPGSIVNVAGIRAPFGGGGEVLAEPWAVVVLRAVDVEWVFVVVVRMVVVVPVAAVLVGRLAVELVAPAVAVDPAVVVPAPAAVVEVLLAEPHPARISTDISPTTRSRRLTGFSINADISGQRMRHPGEIRDPTCP